MITPSYTAIYSRSKPRCARCPCGTDALASQEPFCVDTLEAAEWLQWVFLPRMHALLLCRAPLPQRMAIAPYIEMAYPQELARVAPLLAALQRLDRHLGGDPR